MLVAGLRRLQRSGRRLAGADDVRHGGARAVDIADHARLDLQRILEPGDAGLPAVLRAVDQRLVGGVEVHVAVAGRKRLLDLLDVIGDALRLPERSEEHPSELKSLMRISYAVFCLKKKKQNNHTCS